MTMSKENVNGNYWTCIVGATDKSKLDNGADTPMRRAVDKAFTEWTQTKRRRIMRNKC